MRAADVQRLRRLTGDLAQVASVRPVVLDDGPERGVRALAFRNGGGLDFWALTDRSLDIGLLWWRGGPVAFQSPTGFVHPALIDREGEGGRGFGRGFSGLLVTCGLDHIRQPAAGQPMHGRFAYAPARLLSHGEDWDAEEPVLFATGEARQAAFGAETLVLRRRIEAPIGGAEIRIRDVVENRGRDEARHELLYHVNFGFPAACDGAVVRLDGRTLAGPATLADPAAIPRAASRPLGDRDRATATLETPGGFVAAVEVAADTLPHLQIWQDLRPGAGVIAIEPCTSARTEAGGSAGGRPLGSGEARRYEIVLRFAGPPPDPFDPAHGAG